MRACEHDTLITDGPARLVRFRSEAVPGASTPLLLVPSPINRWYVLDLHAGGSVAEALVAAGLDVYLFDWGVAEDEDRYFGWDDMVARLDRMIRATRRFAGRDKVGLLGYCVGGTLSTIQTALRPELVEVLINLAGPIDFGQGGMLRHFVDPAWFDPAAIAAAGNVAPEQMQAGFVALRPTAQVGKWVAFADKALDPEARMRFEALDGWASDNVPFPAAAYERYITELYQQNQLFEGRHVVAGRRVDLSRIECPLLTLTASDDAICPPGAALALEDRVASSVKDHVQVPGGHVGAVVGRKASTMLYPKVIEWLLRHLDGAATATSERASDAKAASPRTSSSKRPAKKAASPAAD